MNFLRFRHVGMVLLLAGMMGCEQKQSPQEIQQKTAQATAEAKSDAKAVAEGIREGLTGDKRVDLNSATRAQLLELPGVTGAEADKMISGRPYAEPHDLVARHIVGPGEYNRIADRITANR